MCQFQIYLFLGFWGLTISQRKVKQQDQQLAIIQGQQVINLNPSTALPTSKAQ